MRSLATLTVGAIAGCFSPSYPQGLLCGAGNDPCPPGQTCGADNRCAIDPTGEHDAGDAAMADDAGEPSWVIEETPPDVMLHAVWARDRGDIWAVGASGVILHRAATGVWVAEQALDVAATLRAVNGHGQVTWAVGDGGYTTLFDGTSWKPMPLGANDSLIDVVAAVDGAAYAISAANVYARGAKSDGWTALSAVGLAGAKLTAVWATPDGVVVADSTGRSFERVNGNNWTIRDQLDFPIRDITSAGGDLLFYVGTSDEIAFGVRNQTSREALGAVGPWHAVDGFGADTLWAVGDAGATQRVPAATWQLEPTPVPFVAVDVVDAELVLAVGVDGRVYRRVP